VLNESFEDVLGPVNIGCRLVLLNINSSVTDHSGINKTVAWNGRRSCETGGFRARSVDVHELRGI
jgi:hypothetical protein